MKIYCVGDSITYGATLEENLSLRWTDLAAAQTGHHLVNCGLNGDTTAGMMLRCHTKIFPLKPDMVIFLGGTNDICHTWEYRQACANVVSIVRNAQAEGIKIMIGIPLPVNSKVMCAQPWDPTRNASHIAEQFEQYARWISIYCRERNIPTIDFHQSFLRADGSVRGELFSDALHPNAEGHRLMAEALCQALETMAEG